MVEPQTALSLLEEKLGFELEEVDLAEIFDKSKSFSKDINDNVTGVNLDNTNIDDLSILGEFEHIINLSLYKTKISDIDFLSNLKSIEKLDLRGAQQISDFKPLRFLTNIIELNLSNTEISDLDPLNQLYKLRKLHLTSTKIKNLNFLNELHSLIEIHLNDTSITNLAPIAELRNLKTIYAVKCDIKKLPLAIVKGFKLEYDKSKSKTKERVLYIAENPIVNSLILSPELIRKKESAATYLKSIKLINDDTEDNTDFSENLAPLNEVKVLSVGSGGAGKTSVIKRLMNQEFDPNEDQTHGIRVHKHNKEYEDANISINFWDFGGQEVNHATHQFFYSKRSLYILVLDAREDQKADYWLKYIESFGGDSPIIVVLNKIDKNPSFEANRRFLKKKHPNIKEFFRVSCKTGEGIQKLQEYVYQELYNLKLRKTKLAPSWFAVKEELANMEKHYISYDKYNEICSNNGVQENERDVLLDLIHDLGLALAFEELEHYGKQVLSPKWITNGVYRIINSPIVSDKGKKGVLKEEDLKTILDDSMRYDVYSDEWYDYPKDTYQYLTGIMQEFELCYKLNEGEYIIPDLLPVEEPEINYDEYPLHFIIQHKDILPRSVMPRFIVQMHQRISEGTDKRWRTGVIINEPVYESSAIISADYTEKEIRIWVKGRESQRKHMLSFIRKTFEEIRKTFQNLEVTESLIIQGVGKEAKVEYNDLATREKNNYEDYFSSDLEQTFKVKELLDDIETPESREDKTALQVFISYAKEDEVLKDKFKKHLKPLLYEYDLDTWDEGNIYAGQHREKEIKENFENSKLIFFLISSNFLDTAYQKAETDRGQSGKYILKKEIKQALDNHKTDKAKVIPLILRPCDWKGLFGEIKAIPENGKPVTTWENEDTAFWEAVIEIRKVLSHFNLNRLRD